MDFGEALLNSPRYPWSSYLFVCFLEVEVPKNFQGILDDNWPVRTGLFIIHGLCMLDPSIYLACAVQCLGQVM